VHCVSCPKCRPGPWLLLVLLVLVLVLLPGKLLLLCILERKHLLRQARDFPRCLRSQPPLNIPRKAHGSQRGSALRGLPAALGTRLCW